MELYQAGYFRVGTQGEGAGWELIAPSDGFSQTEEIGFKGISAVLVEQKEIPKYSIGVFSYEKSYYLLHMNSSAIAKDHRGSAFVHGYCFGVKDYFELCTRPEKLFGLSSNNFETEYDENIKEYPVKNSLEYHQFDYKGLVKKYGLDKESYKQLVLAALCAIDEYTDSLCIKIDLPLDEYKQAYNEIMYLIMMGIPHHLRVKVTSFSYKTNNAKIYFSNVASGNNVFDMETKECSGVSHYLDEFQFTQLYNTYAIESDDFQKIVLHISRFCETVFANPLKEVSCERFEAGFQAKKNKPIDGKFANNLLKYFCSQNLTDSSEIDNYFIKLLESVCRNGVNITDKKSLEVLNARFASTENEQFKHLYAYIEAGRIAAISGDAGLEKLWNYRQEDEKLYEDVVVCLKKLNPDFCKKYMLDVYLPRTLTSFEKIARYIRRNSTEMEDYDTRVKIFSILKTMLENNLSKANEFKDMSKSANEFAEVLSVMPESCAKEQNNVEDEFISLFWKNFDINFFDTEDIDAYKGYKVEKASNHNDYYEEPNNAAKVCKLINLWEKKLDAEDVKALSEIVLDDRIFGNSFTRNDFIQKLRNKSFNAGRYERNMNFDILLLLFYDSTNREFDVEKWADKLLTNNFDNEFFSPNKVDVLIRRSTILKKEPYRSEFISSLERVVRDKRKAGIIQRNLVRYYNVLMGKKATDTAVFDEETGLSHTIQRIIVGSLALVTMGFYVICLSRYMNIDNIIVLIVSVVGIALIVGCAWAVRFILDDGISGFMEKTGISDVGELIFCGALFVIFGAFAVSLMIVESFLYKLIVLFAITMISIIATIVFYLGAEE